jgi:hypothetical protein
MTFSDGAAAKRLDAREARHEALEIGLHRRDRGLLQHDLRDPDAVRIGALARQRAPGQDAAMAVIPGEEIGGARLGSRSVHGLRCSATAPASKRPGPANSCLS